MTIKQALGQFSADAIRVFVLSSHYRSPLTYSEESLEAAERGADRLRQTANNVNVGKKAGVRIDTESFRSRFIEAMDDDFNSPQALAAIFDLAREINRLGSEGTDTGEARRTFREMGGVLGLTFRLPEKPPLDIEPLRQLLLSINNWLLEAHLKGIPTDKLPADVESLMELIASSRNALRDAQQWQYADKIRHRLKELDMVLQDTVKGTVWKRKR